jgi:riboflavin biosynthesis pyrimidine reductase
MLAPDRVDDLDPLAIDAAYPWPADARWVRCNMVATADGAGRGPAGRSGDINSPADMRLFGMLRGTADVVLVGAATIRAEMYRPSRAKPPYAERRAALGQRPAVVIAIVSRSLDIPFHAPLFTEPVERPILVTVSSAPPDRLAAAQRVADVVVAGDAEVDLAAALTALSERGLPRVHCEGGPSLLAELVARDLLDELDLSLSPMLAGGSYPHEQPPRILTGMPLPDPPRPLRLAHVLEEDGMLFLRYLLHDAGRTGTDS